MKLAMTLLTGTCLIAGIIPAAARAAAEGPAPSFRVGGAIGPAYLPVRMVWGSADPGAEKYELQEQVGGSEYTFVLLKEGDTQGTDLNIVPDSLRRYRLRYSVGGVVSDWTEGPQFSVSFERENSPSIKYAGAWQLKLAGAPRNWGASDRFMAAASSPESTLTYSFQGAQVAWTATTGPDKGLADVSVDGVKQSTVDLYSPDQNYGQLVFARGGLSAEGHTLSITPLGRHHADSEGNEVDVDGFALITSQAR